MLLISPLARPLVFLTKNVIQKDPGIIVGPITQVLGVILNAIFNFVYQFTVSNSLGISIILFTIIVRFIMLPLAVHQQRSMMNMQKIQPLMEKIKKKYEGRKDADSQQKMNAEMQKLYADNKINPFSGCLPIVIQMPIFFALSYIMQQSYRFIDVLGEIYYKGVSSLTSVIISSEGFMNAITPLALPKLPKGMSLDMAVPVDLAKVVNRFSATDWAQLLADLPSGAQAELTGLLTQKSQIEFFFGIDLIERCVSFTGGIGEILAHLWPGVVIPLLVALTTFLTSYIMNKQSKATDQNAKMQQQMMLIVMPIMMGVMTAGFPAGVGLYWITSSVFQVVQQIALGKYFRSRDQKKEQENAEK